MALSDEDTKKAYRKTTDAANEIVSRSCTDNPKQEFCQALVPLNQIISPDQIDKNNHITGLCQAEAEKIVHKINPLFREEVFAENPNSFRSIVRGWGSFGGPLLFILYTIGLALLSDSNQKK